MQVVDPTHDGEIFVREQRNPASLSINATRAAPSRSPAKTGVIPTALMADSPGGFLLFGDAWFCGAQEDSRHGISGEDADGLFGGGASAAGQGLKGRKPEPAAAIAGAVLDGMSREAAAKIGGMDRQTLRALRQAQEGAPVQRGRPRRPPGCLVERAGATAVAVAERANWPRSWRLALIRRSTGSCAGGASTSGRSSRSASASTTMSERLDAEQRLDLLEIIEDHHNTHFIIVTSQVPVDRCDEIVGNPTIADAIVDRLVLNACRIVLKGVNLLKKRPPEPTEPAAWPRRAARRLSQIT